MYSFNETAVFPNDLEFTIDGNARLSLYLPLREVSTLKSSLLGLALPIARLLNFQSFALFTTMHSPSNFFRLLSRNVNGRITFLSPLQRSYSSVPATSPLIKARDIPAPHTGHIRVLTLDSFYNRNSISKQLLAELGHEIGRIQKEAGEEDQSVELKEGSQEEVQQQSKTKVLILSSALDKNFCSGADLIERNNMDRDEYVYIDWLKSFQSPALLIDPLQNRNVPHQPPHHTEHPFHPSHSLHYRSVFRSPRRRSRTRPSKHLPRLLTHRNSRPTRNASCNYPRRGRNLPSASTYWPRTRIRALFDWPAHIGARGV